jgi:uncharacterized protein involved in exopolysaccharide biosynthesis
MRTSHQASPDDIDIVSLWGALRRSLPKLLACTVGAGALTFGVLSLMAPRFASETQLAIVSKSTNPFPDAGKAGVAPDAVTPRMDKEAMNTHARALVAPGLLLKVADDLKLRNKKEFNSALGSADFIGGVLRLAGLAGPRPGESEEDRVLAEVTRRLEVAVAKESRFIPIRFTSSDPDLAAAFANKLAEAYRSSLVADTITETQQVVKALDPKIEELRKDLIAAETEVERYRVQIDRTNSGQQKTPLIEQRLIELTAELGKADGARAEADARWRTARELAGTGSAEVIPEVQKSPLIQGLVQQRVRAERQISELSASLLPGHPRMQQLNADLAGLKRQITSEVQKFVVGLEKEAKAAQSRTDQVNKQIAELKGRVMSTSGDDARLRSLEATAKAKRGELERLQRQLEDNNTVVVTKTVPIEARIISPARASSVPVFPKKGPYSLLAMAATFMLGLAWIVTRELLVGARPAPSGAGGGTGSGKRSLTPQVRSSEPALAAGAAGATASLAAHHPTASEPQDKPMAAPMAAEDAPVSGPGTIAAIVDVIIEKAGTQGGHRTLVTGSERDIDAGSEALATANELAAAGRSVVLVDWSLEGRGMAHLAGVPEKPGVTDLLAGKASFEDVVVRVPNSEVHMMASGSALAVEDVSVDSDGLNLVLDALDEAYDHIVVAANFEEARKLLEAIQGRFDAGVTVSDAAHRVGGLVSDTTFLGFEVTGIELIHYVRPAKTVATPAKTDTPEPAGKAHVKPASRPAAAELEIPFTPSHSIPASRLQMAKGGKSSMPRPAV